MTGGTAGGWELREAAPSREGDGRVRRLSLAQASVGMEGPGAFGEGL